MTQLQSPTTTGLHTVEVTVNGQARSAEVEARILLAHFLRQTLGLTGTHVGCDTTSCGACSPCGGATGSRGCGRRRAKPTLRASWTWTR